MRSGRTSVDDLGKREFKSSLLNKKYRKQNFMEDGFNIMRSGGATKLSIRRRQESSSPEHPGYDNRP